MNNIKEYATVVYIVVYLRYCLVGSASHCTQNYTTDDGKTCVYCPPGTHLSKDCDISGQSAHCMGCGLNHYQNQCNRAESCESCSTNCKHQNMVKVKDCTLYQDIICECLEGKFWKQETESDGVCLAHSMCLPGFGLLALGNVREDTKCEPCIDGSSFSPEKSFRRCQPCENCTSYHQVCITSRNAQCSNTTTMGTNSTTTGDSIEVKTDTKISDAGIILIISFVILITAVIILVVACFCNRQTGSFTPAPVQGSGSNVEQVVGIENDGISDENLEEIIGNVENRHETDLLQPKNPHSPIWSIVSNTTQPSSENQIPAISRSPCDQNKTRTTGSASSFSENYDTSLDLERLDTTNVSSPQEQTNRPLIAEETNGKCCVFDRENGTSPFIKNNDDSMEKSKTTSLNDVRLHAGVSEQDELQMEELTPPFAEAREMNVTEITTGSINIDLNLDANFEKIHST